jgi:hypothetical protein
MIQDLGGLARESAFDVEGFRERLRRMSGLQPNPNTK